MKKYFFTQKKNWKKVRLCQNHTKIRKLTKNAQKTPKSLKSLEKKFFTQKTSNF